MVPRPRPPTFREPAQNAPWGIRMTCMVFNYINHPSLLQATPIGEPWNFQSSSEMNPDLGNSIEHMSQTMLVTDPAYPELFQQTGVNGLPNLHHITFTIGTRIKDREEGQAHEIWLRAQAYDSADNVFPDPDGDPSDDIGCGFFMDVGGWAGSPADLLVPVLKDIFGDWRCVVEYLKYMIGISQSNDAPDVHPLLHMDILGDGMTFRRATLRIAGSIVMGADMVNGVPTRIFEDNRTWQEFRNGGWEDL
ncbi:hypothetical protein EG329_006718 [Mollisiaceae sp. DMI_Dod_QoI]|nr:hypothetical protein EG329_006718 [Helotiales sp. DMI_Dod_QoI]